MDEKTVLVIEDSSVVSDLVRDLLMAAGLTVVQSSNSRDALALLDERGFDAIVADATMPHVDGYGVLAQVRAKPAHRETPVLLLTSGGEVPAGPAPNDYIKKPVDPVDLIVRVRAAVGREVPPPVLPGSDNGHRPEPGSDGEVITVFSLKGGVGASVIAVNLAVALKKLWNGSVAVVDLSLEAGGQNILLDILPTSTIDELVSREDADFTADAIEQYLVQHRAGISLLSAPPAPERAEYVTGPELRTVLTVLRRAFDYVVIDTASTFTHYTLLALDMADKIILPVSPEIASVRAAATALDTFHALSIADETVVPVFNEVWLKGLTRDKVESSLHLPLKALPHGGQKLAESVNLGKPLVWTDPDAPWSVALENLAFELSKNESDALDLQARGRSKAPDLLVKVRKRLRV